MLNREEDKKATDVCVGMSHATSKVLTVMVFIIMSILQKFYLLCMLSFAVT